jgi:hypothetical protein
MRASSLSSSKVIDLLNHYFIAVHADGVFYNGNAGVPAEEKAAYQRVFQDFHKLNQKNKDDGKPQLSIGSVHAYVLTADGQPMDSLHVGEAKPDKVAAMLEKAIQTLKVPEGKSVVKPVPQSAPPKAKADALVLHLTARYLQLSAGKNANEEFAPLKPELGTASSGQWSALPSEDWIELPKPVWLKLLPANRVEVGASWEPDREAATQLLTRFYPTTENNDLSTNRIDKQSLKATVVSVKDGVIRARLEGSLKMKHTFYPRRDDENKVEASVIGYLDFQQDTPKIRSLRLVTDRATYGGASRYFGVAVRSVASSAD